MQFSLLGDTQVVISDEAMVNELFVKRGAIYSGRNAPHAFKTITQDLSIAMVGKNGTLSPEVSHRSCAHCWFNQTHGDVNESY